MAQILIREIEQSVVDRLKERAQQNGRSLQAELRLILKQVAGTSFQPFMADIERVRAMYDGETFSDSTELQREERERR